MDEPKSRTYQAVDEWLRSKRHLSAQVFDRIRASGEMDAAIQGYVVLDDSPADLLEAFDNIYDRLVRKRKSKPKQPRRRHSWSLLEGRRALAFSNQLGRLASREAEQFRFMNEIKRVLTPDEARSVLSSPLAAWTSSTEFVSRGIPLIGHAASAGTLEIRRYKDHGVSYRLPFTVTWSGGSASFTKAHGAPENAALSEFHVLFWAESSMTGEHGALVTTHSLLGELRKASHKLSGEYPWRPSSAAWFLLTDEAPFIPPATVTSRRRFPEHFLDATVTVTAQPWVGGETVRDLWERERQTLRFEGSREVPEKLIALFEFAMTRALKEPKENRIKVLWKEWNEVENSDRPELQYPTLSGFKSAIDRMERVIMHFRSANEPASRTPNTPGKRSGPARTSTKKRK